MQLHMTNLRGENLEVEYEKNNLKCSEIWCYSRSDCEWELSSAQVCK